MPSKNQRVELEMKIMKYRALARCIAAPHLVQRGRTIEGFVCSIAELHLVQRSNAAHYCPVPDIRESSGENQLRPATALLGRLEPAVLPARRIRFHGIGGDSHDLRMIAPGAVERPDIKTGSPPRNARQRHSRFAFGASRTLQGGERKPGG